MRKLKAKITAVGKLNTLTAQANACFTCRRDFEVLKSFGLTWPCFIRAPLRDAVKRERTPPIAICQVCVGILSNQEFESLSDMVEHVTSWRPSCEFAAPKLPTTLELILAWELLAQPNAPKVTPISIANGNPTIARPSPSSNPQALRNTPAAEVVEILGGTEGLELPSDPPMESESTKALESLLSSIGDAKASGTK